MNASPVNNTTSNVVSPGPSDSEHVEEAPICPQRMRLPPSLFTYDTFQNPTFRPAAVSYIQTCPIYGQLPQTIPYVSPALPFITHQYQYQLQGATCQHHLYQRINFETGCSNDIISCIAFLSTYLRYYFIILLCHYRIWKLRIVLLIH